MKKFIQAASAFVLSSMPVFALAESGQTLGGIFQTFGSLVGILTPVIVALALLGFFWGLAMYILNFSGEDKEKKKGRDMMVYGVLVLFVIVSVWGIVNVLQNTFGIDEIRNQQIPSVDRRPV